MRSRAGKSFLISSVDMVADVGWVAALIESGRETVFGRLRPNAIRKNGLCANDSAGLEYAAMKSRLSYTPVTNVYASPSFKTRSAHSVLGFGLVARYVLGWCLHDC